MVSLAYHVYYNVWASTMDTYVHLCNLSAVWEQINLFLLILVMNWDVLAHPVPIFYMAHTYVYTIMYMHGYLYVDV